jgi:hypothetical protein
MKRTKQENETEKNARSCAADMFLSPVSPVLPCMQKAALSAGELPPCAQAGGRSFCPFVVGGICPLRKKDPDGFPECDS